MTLEQVEATPVRCPDAGGGRADDRADRGGAQGPGLDRRRLRAGGGRRAAGLGEPVFDKLKADLAKALLSLPAVTAFEYGAGFAVATMRGSAEQRRVRPARTGKIGTETNRHGGMLGGISQRRADRLPGGGQADEQPAAAAADRDARRASRRRS